MLDEEAGALIPIRRTLSAALEDAHDDDYDDGGGDGDGDEDDTPEDDPTSEEAARLSRDLDDPALWLGRLPEGITSPKTVDAWLLSEGDRVPVLAGSGKRGDEDVILIAIGDNVAVYPRAWVPDGSNWVRALALIHIDRFRCHEAPIAGPIPTATRASTLSDAELRDHFASELAAFGDDPAFARPRLGATGSLWHLWPAYGAAMARLSAIDPLCDTMEQALAKGPPELKRRLALAAVRANLDELATGWGLSRDEVAAERARALD
jgi:hypothetical protein